MSDNKREAIYIELDALLDTRLGTIARINEDAAVATLEDGYHARDIDAFTHVDMAVYHDLYAQRNTITLMYSRPTHWVLNLTRIAGLLSEQAIARPYHEGAKIVVNLFPYKLTDAEADQIGKAVAAWMKGLAPVELTSLQPQHLTPLHCKQHYAMMIVYEFEEWMNLHTEAFKTTRIPEILMLAPAVYRGKKPTAEELAQEIKEAAHPMRALEMLASPLIELRLIDTKYFSVLSNA